MLIVRKGQQKVYYCQVIIFQKYSGKFLIIAFITSFGLKKVSSCGIISIIFFGIFLFYQILLTALKKR